jgi:hypothetical protein
MRIFQIALLLIVAVLIQGCAATGKNFSGVELPSKSNSVVYFLRRSNFTGAAYCPPVQIDGTDIGCLKNGGFIRYELANGTHEIKIRKRFLEVGDEITETLEARGGEVIFYEWGIWSEFDGGNFYEALVERPEHDAIKILKSLKESI